MVESCCAVEQLIGNLFPEFATCTSLHSHLSLNNIFSLLLDSRVTVWFLKSDGALARHSSHLVVKSGAFEARNAEPVCIPSSSYQQSSSNSSRGKDERKENFRATRWICLMRRAGAGRTFLVRIVEDFGAEV